MFVICERTAPLRLCPESSGLGWSGLIPLVQKGRLVTRRHDVDRPPSPKMIAAASFIGTMIEWYDFYLYGLAAALVFNRVYFPDISPLVGTILAFGTFGIGFVARPVGAMLFGHWGDRIGRKSVLVATLVLMGGATLGIGLLPDYNSLGEAAPVLLVALRLVQGLGVGGEWGGAVLIATENVEPRKKTLFGSFAQLGSPAGLVLSTAAFTTITTVFDDADVVRFAWRIPFILSVLLILVGLLIRLKLGLAGEFDAARKHQLKANRLPVVEVVIRYGRPLLIGILAFTCVFLVFYLMSTFVLTYATESLGMARSVVLPANLIGAVAEGLFIVLGVLAAKRYTARIVAVCSGIGLAMWAVPSFLFINSKVPGLLYLAISVSLALVGCVYGVLAADVSEMFPADVRYTGSSISYHVSGVIGGGLGPIVATYFLAVTGSVWPVGCLTVGACIVTSVACVWLPKRESRKGRARTESSTAAIPGAVGAAAPGEAHRR